jgi:hypothetical protein
MTIFEQEFIEKSLTLLHQILSCEAKLADAIHAFTQDDPHNHRYQLNSKITDAKNWEQLELLQVSAAYSETLFRIICSYSQDPTISPQHIDSVIKLLEKDYFSVITSNTTPKQRISSITNKIAQIKFDKIDTEDSNPVTEKPTAHPYKFFTPETTTAGFILTASLAAAATLYFAAK